MAKQSINKDLSPCKFSEPVLTTTKKIWMCYYKTIMVVCLVGIPPDRKFVDFLDTPTDKKLT